MILCKNYLIKGEGEHILKFKRMRDSLRANKWIIYLPAVMCFNFLITFLFFNSFLVASSMFAISVFLKSPIQIYTYKTQMKIREKEFMVFIYTLSSTLSVGRSFESAVKISVEEIKKEKARFLLLEDFEAAVISLEANADPGEVFDKLAVKYNIESIVNFSKIIQLTLRRGGSLNKVIERTVGMIEEKCDVENELDVIIAQKKYELIILLSFVPLMLLYLKTVSPDFSAAMYETLRGRVVMSICLLLYLASGVIGKRIVEIKI